MDRGRKRVLLTGADGFTGRYMEAELEGAGWRVIATGSKPVPNRRNHIPCDLCDAGAVESLVSIAQPHIVVHLAGVAFVGGTDIDAFYRVNLMGTRNLLNALAANPVSAEAILLVSSANVYGNARGGVLEESMAVEPANDYAVSKVAMEYMAKLWMDKLPLFIVRPFNYTGVGQSPQFLVPKIVDHFRCRAPYIELGNIDVSRDFSDVRSVVAAYRRLIEICPAGEIFNICSGQATSLRQVIDLSEEITGHRLEVRVNPDFVRENEIKSLVGSPDKLRDRLGEQLSIPFRQTLEWMLSAP